MSLYEGAVKKPIMTSLCFLAVVIFGLFSLSKLPIDLYPDIDTNTIMVMTAYPGASASDIENNVTRPLENVLNSVSDLKHITSRSSENMSLITLEFEFGNDIDVLTNDVRDKLDMVSSELPDDAENPIIFKFSTDMIPIVLLSVQANESQSALYKILDDRVVNPLARIPGVGTVSISGAPQREIQVYCDPYKLEAYNLSIETISSIIGAENKNIPGGNFDIGNETYSLRVEGEFDDSRQLADVVVGTYNGATVYLRDVARIVDTVEERAQETYNNGVQGAMIVVQKQSGANSVEISKKVQDALPRLQKNLPSDVKLGVIVDTSENILNTIDSLTETVLYALLFVVIVVFLFLGRWRATLIICITIPLSLTLHSHRYGGGRCHCGVGERHDTHRARFRSQAGVRSRNERGGDFRNRFYADDDCRVLPADDGYRYVRRAVQTVGLDDVRHYVRLHRCGPDAYADALFAVAAFAA